MCGGAVCTLPTIDDAAVATTSQVKSSQVNQHTPKSSPLTKSRQVNHTTSQVQTVQFLSGEPEDAQILPVAYFAPEGGHRAPVAYFFRHPRFL